MSLIKPQDLKTDSELDCYKIVIRLKDDKVVAIKPHLLSEPDYEYHDGENTSHDNNKGLHCFINRATAELYAECISLVAYKRKNDRGYNDIKSIDVVYGIVPSDAKKQVGYYSKEDEETKSYMTDSMLIDLTPLKSFEPKRSYKNRLETLLTKCYVNT